VKQDLLVQLDQQDNSEPLVQMVYQEKMVLKVLEDPKVKLVSLVSVEYKEKTDPKDSRDNEE